MKNKFSIALSLAVILSMLLTSLALADQIVNNLDGTVDATFEVLSLNTGGPNGSVGLYVVTTDGDGHNGCNFQGHETLVVSVDSSNASVATVSPSSVTFGSCGDIIPLTVIPGSTGSTTITLSQTSNTTNDTFQLNTATFTVNVAPPPNTPPSVSVTGVTAGTAYEFGSVPVAGCSVSDAEDGVKTVTPVMGDLTGPLASYGLGSQEVTCSYTDSGGLTTTASVTYAIVDTTAPDITFVGQTPAANGNGWNNSDVTLEWSCSDSVGVVSESVSQTLTDEGADQSATGTCEDVAGNTASDEQTGINIDLTAPTASASASPAPNANGWNNTDVTVSFSGNDALSGIDFCDAAAVLSSDGADQSASGTCTDKAGNVSAAAAVNGINIDKTAPTLSPSVSPNPVLLNGSATTDPGASDILSGIDTASCGVVDTSSVGPHSVDCSATDKAGNSTSAPASYSVQYATGVMCLGAPGHSILQPINADGSSVFKQKSTVPAKFRVCDANGISIGTAGVVSSFRLVQTINGTTSDIDEAVVSTTPDTAFRWDSTDQQWIFNINTKNSNAGKTYVYRITLNDGSTIQFQFGLK